MTNVGFCITMATENRIPADIISDRRPESFYRDAGQESSFPPLISCDYWLKKEFALALFGAFLLFLGLHIFWETGRVRCVCLFVLFAGRITMEFMEKRILTEGKVLPGGILKVGSFLNQQIDPELLAQIGQAVKDLYGNDGVTKILTIESSGIAIAAAVGLAMGVPVVFAKKHRSSNVDGSVYTALVHSYTHNTDYTIVVSSDYLRPEDHILLVDDFLANGKALEGLCSLVSAAGATLVGAAIAIEKGFQGGGDALRARGIRVESLAILDAMSDDGITFRA